MYPTPLQLVLPGLSKTLTPAYTAYRLFAKMVRAENHEYLTEEEKRLKEDREREKYWKKWGPYVAERQWATGKCP